MPIEMQLTPESRRRLAMIQGRLRIYGNSRLVNKSLNDGLRKGAAPLTERVRQAALSLPSRGMGQRNLRQRIASAAGVQVKTATKDPSVAIRIDRSKMGDATWIPKRMNEGRWRHPVFGNRDVWVTQTSRRGWFDEAVKDNRSVEVELRRVINRIERRVSSK